MAHLGCAATCVNCGVSSTGVIENIIWKICIYKLIFPLFKSIVYTMRNVLQKTSELWLFEDKDERVSDDSFTTIANQK